jgi:hypothetical protein
MSKEESGGSGTHTDNDLTEVQEIMEDNDLPTFYSTEKEDEDDDDEQEEP